MTEAPPIVYPDQEMLDKFEALKWDEGRKATMQQLLFAFKVGTIAELPRAAAEKLYERLTRPEKGLRVTFIPMGQGYDKMTARNQRRFVKKHMAEMGILDMMLDDFEQMTKTDQFQFLHARLPDKHMPIQIVRWFHD